MTTMTDSSRPQLPATPLSISDDVFRLQFYSIGALTLLAAATGRHLTRR